ncbi:MAG: hypothetical protein FWF10_03280 [Clostridiales bacterium]|nr:hypothetical protein [Clostridiales bacterium]
MSGDEILVFLASLVAAVLFFVKWYRAIFAAWPKSRGKLGKILLGVLPVLAFLIIRFVLKNLASYDVIFDPSYITFYIFLGFACLAFGCFMMRGCFDLSWRDDVLHLNNRAAAFAFAGGFLGITLIYAAANIGDGPGWWCVIFAGGLGLGAWFLSALILQACTRVFERVTVERDLSCGIRLGCYLIASGILLGRASAGDWTSFQMTVIEFWVGWPVLPLTALAIIGELLCVRAANERETLGNNIAGSVLWGVIMIAAAICSVVFLIPGL